MSILERMDPMSAIVAAAEEPESEPMEATEEEGQEE